MNLVGADEPLLSSSSSSSSSSSPAAAADQLDRLPDELVVAILQKVEDARSLLRCLCVSKRFSSLVPLVRSLHLSLPRRKPISKPTSLFSCFSLFVSKFIVKPFKHLCRVKSTPSSVSDSSKSLNRVLRNFREIDSVHIRLPFYGGTDHDDVAAPDGFDSLVKWKAEFGRDLKTCLIMGATSLLRINDEEEEQEEESVNGELVEMLSDRELRLRVVWIISSLISASARHHFLKQIVSDHPCLGSVVVSDGNRQGRLCMGREQLAEMMMGSASGSMERTPVPELTIKMSYVRLLQLPETGFKMRGATLVEVRALTVGDARATQPHHADCGFDGNGEEKAFAEAAREMLKVKKSYVMTMAAF